MSVAEPRRSRFDPLLAAAARIRAKSSYRRLLLDAENAPRTQERILRRLLARNADSDFGRDHGFERIRDTEQFRRQIPVRDYDQLQPYVRRMIRGRSEALLGSRRPVRMFALTSGSTDAPKHIPVTDDFIADYRRGWNAFGFKALLDHPHAFLRPILQVTSPMNSSYAESGVPCGAISGLLAASQNAIVRRYYAAPPEVAAIPDPIARHYAVMRFAVPRDVAWIVTASPATPVMLARLAATHAERLIRDVRDGTLTPPGELSSDAGQRLLAQILPDPAAARRLQKIAETNGELTPKRYWNLAFLANWTGGTLALHLREFPRWFGDVPVRDIGLLATEGRVSVGLDDANSAGLLDVGSSFFEFVEPDDDADDPRAVRLCHELDVGAVYRVILTNSAGLYRYDLGDCVRVTGYVGKAPLIEFLHRGSRVSSVTGEKLTEWQVARAVQRSCDALGLTLRDFVVAPVWDDPPYYRLHVDQPIDLVADFVRRVDRELAELNVEYAAKRSSGRLGELSLNRLPTDSLAARRRERLLRQRSSAEQLKPQFLLTVPGSDADLVGNAESNAGVDQGQVAGPG